MKLKITTVGNSVGVVLPKELLAKLRVEKGDSLYVTELADGIKLGPRSMTAFAAPCAPYRHARRTTVLDRSVAADLSIQNFGLSSGGYDP